MKVKLNNNKIDIIRLLAGYPAVATYFGLVHPISKQRTITIIDGGDKGVTGRPTPMFHTCREVMNNYVRRAKANLCTDDIKLDKARMLVWHRDLKSKHKCDEKSVLKVLNCIEEERGWDMTRVHEVNMGIPENKTINTDSFLFIGPKQWTSSPYMMGIYMLLIRAMLKVSTTPSKMIVFDDINTLTQGLAKNSVRNKDIDKLKYKNKSWRMIIDNYKLLHVGGVRTCWFGDKGYKELCASLYELFGDGPDSLIAGNSRSEVMQKRFNKLTP